jgi:hypothetical protein
MAPHRKNSGQRFKKMYMIDEEDLNRQRQKQLRDYDLKLRAMQELESEFVDALGRKDLTLDQRLELWKEAKNRYKAIQEQYRLEPKTRMPAAPIAPAPSIPPPPPPPPPPALIRHTAPSHSTPILPRVTVPKISPREGAEVKSFKDTDPFSLFESSDAENENEGESSKFNADENVSDETLDLNYDKIYESLPRQQKKKFYRLISPIKHNRDKISASSTNQLVIDGKVIPGSDFSDLVTSLFVHNKSYNMIGLDQFLHALRSLKINDSFISNKYVRDNYTSLTSHERSLGKRKLRKQLGNGRAFPPGKQIRILRVY